MTDKPKAVLVYVTAGSRAEALEIGRACVEERLAACANVLGEIASLFWWEGKVQEESETPLILKTRPDLVAPLITRIKALHSYSVPCVVAVPIIEGNPDFLDWIVKETALVIDKK